MKSTVNNDVKESVKKTKSKEIAFFILTALFFLFFEAIWYLLGIKYNKLSTQNKILLMFVKYIVFIIIYIIRYHKYLKTKWKDFIKNRHKYSGIGFKWWGIGFIIMVVANTIIARFIVSGSGANEEAVQTLLKSEPLLMIISTTLFAPFVEELMYRKSLQDCFNNKLLYIIMSGLLFGFVHVMGANNPLEYVFIIPYGAFGICFAKALSDTDNIYTTILVHMFHNGVLSILSVISLVIL